MRRLGAREAQGTGLLEPPPEPEHIFRPSPNVDRTSSGEAQGGSAQDNDVEMLLLDVNEDGGDSSSMDSEMETNLQEEIKKMRDREKSRNRYEFTDVTVSPDEGPNAATEQEESRLLQVRERSTKLGCFTIALIMAVMVVGGAYRDKEPLNTTTEDGSQHLTRTPTLSPTSFPTNMT
mmetsp:Transcript_1544/g.2164  ORF Transcript_1544/g.2164 Transcript_1544/m.2164 type:complete len:177 (-) Transcript_1544:182-712(-)